MFHHVQETLALDLATERQKLTDASDMFEVVIAVSLFKIHVAVTVEVIIVNRSSFIVVFAVGTWVSIL